MPLLSKRPSFSGANWKTKFIRVSPRSMYYVLIVLVWRDPKEECCHEISKSYLLSFFCFIIWPPLLFNPVQMLANSKDWGWAISRLVRSLLYRLDLQVVICRDTFLQLSLLLYWILSQHEVLIRALSCFF